MYKWNNKFRYQVASCWLFILSYTTMHGSMNIKPFFTQLLTFGFFGISDNTASNGRKTGESWKGRDLEGIGRNLCDIPAHSWTGRGKLQKASLKHTVNRPRYKANMNQGQYHSSRLYPKWCYVRRPQDQTLEHVFPCSSRVYQDR